MIQVRKSSDRGHFQFDWLETYHTFSFGEYRDSRFQGFRSLRVLNEDFIQPSKGFETHGHRDMEIISYVLRGALSHKDSLGNGSTILPGDVQFMSAGSGVTHSEHSASTSETTHLIQIWILPKSKGSSPRYEQKVFSSLKNSGNLLLVCSEEGRQGSIRIDQAASVYVCHLKENSTERFKMKPQRFGYVHVMRGSTYLQHHLLMQGDGAFISQEVQIEWKGHSEECEFLFFDLE